METDRGRKGACAQCKSLFRRIFVETLLLLLFLPPFDLRLNSVELFLDTAFVGIIALEPVG